MMKIDDAVAEVDLAGCGCGCNCASATAAAVGNVAAAAATGCVEGMFGAHIGAAFGGPAGLAALGVGCAIGAAVEGTNAAVTGEPYGGTPQPESPSTMQGFN